MSESQVFRPEFEFLAPEYLWFLPLVIALFFMGKLLAGKRGLARRQMGFSFTTDLMLCRIVPPLIAFLLIFALLRPSIGTTIQKFQQDTHSLFIALDLSRSMLAEDVSPNRLVSAKRAITDLLSNIEQLSGDIRVSIILFSGSAVTFCPLTSDLEILRMYAREISPELFSSRGTSLLALKRIIEEKKTSLDLKTFTVALFSDGEFSDYEQFSDMEMLGNDISLFTYGIGKHEGVPIPLGNGALQKNRYGDIVITKLEPDSLKTIANNSGGVYVELNSFLRPFSPLLAHIENQMRENTETSEQHHSVKYEIFHYAIWGVLLVVGFLSLIPLRGGILVLCFCLSSIFCIEPVQADSSELRSALDAYAEKDYENALRHLRLQSNRSSRDIHQQEVLGATLFRLEKYQEAGEVFRSIAAESETGRTIAQALYNAGNSYLAEQRAEDAIQAYEEALAIHPDDEKALHNLEIAKALKEQQEEQTQQSKDEEQNNQEQSQENATNEEPRSNSEEQPSSDNNPQQDQSTSEQEESGEREEHGSENQSEEPSPQEQRQEQQANQEGTTDQNENQEGMEIGDATEESEQDLDAMRDGARLWLDSLPQAPILLPLHKDEMTKGGQEW